MPILHDFDKKDSESHASDVVAFVKAACVDFYEGYTIKDIIEIPKGKSRLQLLGVDFIVYLVIKRRSFDEKIRKEYIDIKLRFYSDSPPMNYDYSDILWEYERNDRRHFKGWGEQTLLTDYILYIFWPIHEALWIPFVPAVRAWAKNKVEWLEEFGKVKASNKGYKTLSCPVAITDFYEAIKCDSFYYIREG